MPSFDATAAAALGLQVFSSPIFLYVDFVGSPLRVTNHGIDQVLAGTGLADLDGTYEAQDGGVLEVGEVVNQQGGSDTLTLSLSGIVSIDDAALAIIADRTKWYLRPVKLWIRMENEAGVQQGAIVHYATRYMTGARIVPSPESQTIEIVAENYLVLLREASGRTYLSQKDYDAADTSAAATIGAANAGNAGPAKGISTGGGGGGGIDRGMMDRGVVH